MCCARKALVRARASAAGLGVVVSRAVIVAEGMAGGIEMIDALRIGAAQMRSTSLSGMALVVLAEMQHGRARRRLGQLLGNAAAVVADRGTQRHFAGRGPGQRAAPAEADDRDPADVAGHRRGGGDIQHRLGGVDLLAIAQRLLASPAANSPAPDCARDAIEQRRRHRQVALGRIAVGHAAGYGRQAEDLLHDDHRAARPCRRAWRYRC